MGYKKDVIKGISFIGSLKFLTKAVGFIEAIILARILAPEQFGAYAIALLTLGVLEVLTETGVNIFLVQEKNVDKYINSAWVVSIFRGIALTIILLLLSPFVSNFFHSPQSLSLLYLISLIPLLRGFINPSIIKFQKELLFGKDFKYKITILVIDTIISIVATYITKNPIGIIFGLFAGVVVELFLSFFVVSPRPKLDFNKSYISKLFHRGKWVTMAGFFDYLFENIDNIIVGRLLGTASLGVYQLAYALSVVPLNEVGKVFVHVTTPIMIRFSNDPSRLRRAFIKTTVVLFLLILPIAFILFIFPKIFVFFLGKRWEEIIMILPILAIVGLVRSMSGYTSALFLSVKKQNFVAIRTMVTIIFMLIFIFPLINTYGLPGAGLSALIGSLLAIPIVLYFIFKILK